MSMIRVVGLAMFGLSLLGVCAPASAAICDNDGRCIERSAAPARAIPLADRGRHADRRGAWAIIKSKKTGATAQVAPARQASFQAYIDEVEAHGAAIKFMHGVRRERCAPPRHKHACGDALDTCQERRDVVSPACHLPPRQTMISIAARHGLTEGGQWCDGDRGHVEAGPAAAACGRIVQRRHLHKRIPIVYAFRRAVAR